MQDDLCFNTMSISSHEMVEQWQSSSALNSRKIYKCKDELKIRPRKRLLWEVGKDCSGRLEKTYRFSSVLKSDILLNGGTCSNQNGAYSECK